MTFHTRTLTLTLTLNQVTHWNACAFFAIGWHTCNRDGWYEDTNLLWVCAYCGFIYYGFTDHGYTY